MHMLRRPALCVLFLLLGSVLLPLKAVMLPAKPRPKFSGA
jgi:hypothetical protein